MKNKMLKMTAALTVFSAILVGCGQAEAPATEAAPVETAAETVAAETQTLVPATLLEDIAPALDCLYSWDQETYGAIADFDTAMMAGLKDGKISVLYDQNDKLPEGYEQDPGFIRYHPVFNFASLEEVKKELSKYVTDEVLAEMDLEEAFLEFEGKLYLVRGARGYGAYLCDVGTVKYLGEKDGLQQITIGYNLFDNYSNDVTVSFLETEEGWKIAAVENRQ